MLKELSNYCKMLTQIVPYEVYLFALIVFCLGTLFSLMFMGFRKGGRYSLMLLLIEYVSILYGNTIFFRHKYIERDYDYTPFWSYESLLEGNISTVLPGMIMNVVVFVPVGALAGLLLPTPSWKKIMLLGVLLSIGIELLQLALKKGFFEFDDVMHNTLGCMIGYGIYLLLKTGYKHCIVKVKNEE